VPSGVNKQFPIDQFHTLAGFTLEADAESGADSSIAKTRILGVHPSADPNRDHDPPSPDRSRALR
jgi:hypothetical protein